MRIDIPGRSSLEISHLVLDYNGTLACNGVLNDELSERLISLSNEVAVHIITADTYGTVQSQCDGLGVSVHVIERENQDIEKLRFLESLGSGSCIAVGNGMNDVLMLQHAALGFAVIQEEGACTKAVMASDVVFRSILDAMDALIHPERLAATLRN